MLTTSAEAERIRRAAAAVVGIRQRELFEQPSLLMLQETGSFQPFLTWARSTRQCIQRSPSNAVLRAREPGPAAQPSASAPSRARARSCDMCGAQVNRAHIPPAPPPPKRPTHRPPHRGRSAPQPRFRERVDYPAQARARARRRPRRSGRAAPATAAGLTSGALSCPPPRGFAPGPDDSEPSQPPAGAALCQPDVPPSPLPRRRESSVLLRNLERKARRLPLATSPPPRRATPRPRPRPARAPARHSYVAPSFKAATPVSH